MREWLNLALIRWTPSPSPLRGEGRGEGRTATDDRVRTSRGKCGSTGTLAPHPNPLPKRERGPIRERPRRSVARGFTLLEALLAGVILAAVGVTVGAAVVGSLRSSAAGRDYAAAAALLDETMTRIDLIGPSRLLTEGPTSGEFPEPFERFRWSADITEPNLPDLYEVVLTVTWRGDTGERSAVVATRLYDPINARNALLEWGDL